MLKKIRNFLENTSGSILPTMAILTVPLAITAGAAIDYSRYVNMRSEIQVGIDAAGIAAVAELPEIRRRAGDAGLTGSAFNAKVQTEITNYANSFMQANIKSEMAKNGYKLTTRYIPATRDEDGGVEMVANITYDTIFGGVDGGDGGILLFQDKVTDKLTSIITTGNRTIEVALVMDNSGSMYNYPSGGSKRKIDSMKDAATELVSDLFKSAADSVSEEPVKFSLVPFAGAVNVGPLGHPNLKGNFIDTRGMTPANNENLDWRNTFRTNEEITVTGGHIVTRVGNVIKSRLDVFDMIGEPWKGCVEMRAWPHNVLDTYVPGHEGGYIKINGKMDADGDGTKDGVNALFVPYFAPDEPDWEHADDYNPGPHISRKREHAEDVDHNDDDDRYPNSYLYDFRDYIPDNDTQHIQLYTNDHAEVVTTGQNPNGSGDGTIPNIADDQNGSTNQINRTNWMFKYQSNVPLGTFGDYFGPNYGCTTDPITPLTSNLDTINDAIDDMKANGSTNIQQGLTWGWRTLSEALPFDQGRPLSDEINLKFIILLTDGANFYSTDGDTTPNVSAYGAWGYMRPDTHPLKHALNDAPTHNRIAEGMSPQDLAGTIYEGQTFDLTPDNSYEFGQLMNVHTAQACENAKKAGISIYTIVYDLNNQATEDLMRACAGTGVIDNQNILSGVTFYHEADGATLEDTFAEIASSISAIRIAK